jgi:hypothetical protein
LKLTVQQTGDDAAYVDALAVGDVRVVFSDGDGREQTRVTRAAEVRVSAPAEGSKNWTVAVPVCVPLGLPSGSAKLRFEAVATVAAAHCSKFRPSGEMLLRRDVYLSVHDAGKLSKAKLVAMQLNRTSATLPPVVKKGLGLVCKMVKSAT